MKNTHETEIISLYYHDDMSASDIFKHFNKRIALHKIAEFIAKTKISISTEKYYILESKMNYL